MPKKFQLQIPDPCHENWDKMSPVEKGRFCGACQKAVIDFTGMNDAQLIAYFKKSSTGSVCGRFNNDQLERDIRIPGKRLPWLKYFLNLLIPAFLISVKARSQGKPVLTGDTTFIHANQVHNQVKRSLEEEKAIGSNRITGRLTDYKGLPVAFGSVVIKGTNRGVACDAEGNFSLKLNSDTAAIKLVFSSVGFVTKEIELRTGRANAIGDIGMVQLENSLAGEVVIVGLISPRKKKPVKIFQRIIRDTLTKFLKIYPNPVLAGTQIKIELRAAETGEYHTDLINRNGQIIHSSFLHFDKNLSNFYTIPMAAAGTYFLNLTHKKSGKKYIEKILIQ